MPVIRKYKDGSIDIIYLNQNKFGEGKKPISSFKGLEKLEEGTDWFWTDEKIDKSDLESREQLYWEEEDGDPEPNCEGHARS